MNELITIKKIEQAKLAIMEVNTLDEIKQIIDQTEAMKAYAKSAKLSADVQILAQELNVRADRKLGEISLNLAKSKPGVKSELGNHGGLNSKLQELEKIGVTKQYANTAEKLASIPEKIFEERIIQARDTATTITKTLFKNISNELNGKTKKQNKPRTWNFVFESRAFFADNNKNVIGEFEKLNKLKDDGERVDCMRNSIDFMTDCIKAYKRAITEMGYELKE